jgi:hypothetical protein
MTPEGGGLRRIFPDVYQVLLFYQVSIIQFLFSQVFLLFLLGQVLYYLLARFFILLARFFIIFPFPLAKFSYILEIQLFNDVVD